MNKKEIYAEYLQSEKWKVVRECTFIIHGKSCKKCGAETNLQVHHLRYPEILGNENVSEDLIVLCKECHQKVHGIEAIVYKDLNMQKESGVIYLTWTNIFREMLDDGVEDKHIARLLIARDYLVMGHEELAKDVIKDVPRHLKRELDWIKPIVKSNNQKYLKRKFSKKTKKINRS